MLQAKPARSRNILSNQLNMVSIMGAPPGEGGGVLDEPPQRNNSTQLFPPVPLHGVMPPGRLLVYTIGGVIDGGVDDVVFAGVGVAAGAVFAGVIGTFVSFVALNIFLQNELMHDLVGNGFEGTVGWHVMLIVSITQGFSEFVVAAAAGGALPNAIIHQMPIGNINSAKIP